ncbi:P-loop NTPase fold protein [Marinobacter sp. M216]|uniref:P-loop NTPase fold protein n=1 Tax=Marinobacter albus TaxID=3030833 RepID=A0ABT7H6T9_9GAMM|nr:P-loop NTPase fold protein [Marinobacter sp. M216]MDK9556076.1 P-loop NTPase fold protein [Marinobacter sp. M216]
MTNEMATGNQTKTDNWAADKLDRESQAVLLTNFLKQQYENRSSRFALNINSSWGFGKTFFLDRWKRDLEDQSYLVLEYNAWENDYSKDPLMSFLYEISSQLSRRLDECAKTSKDAQVVKNANASLTANKELTEFLKSNGLQLMRSLISVSTGMKVPEGINLGTSPYEAEQKRKEAVEEFKKKLSNVIGTIKQHEGAGNEYFKAPLYVFIDELDRCRPNFTIELIEVVKHICNVDHIFFIFATDGEQLQASLRGMYGPGFDAEVYFNRIFSREVHLSLPNNHRFAKALEREYEMFDSEDNLGSLIFASYPEVQSGIEKFYVDFQWVSDAFNLDLRSQHQLAATFDTLMKTRAYENEQTFTVGALVLILLWQRKKQLFKDLVSSPLKTQSKNELSKLFRGLGGFEDRKGPVLCPKSADSWDVAQITISEVMMSFLQLLHASRKEIIDIKRGEVTSFFFVQEICESPANTNRHRPHLALPSLLKMIDQIMLAA